MGQIWSQTFSIPPPSFTENELPDQTGKTHVITGGYSGIGYELVSILYAANATIFIAGRDPSKAHAAISQIQLLHPQSQGKLEFLPLDLSDLSKIRPAVDDLLTRITRLDVLVNNAGIMVPPAGSKTAQGHELQLGVNVLGPFLFTSLLIPILQKTASLSPPGSVRILWPASLAVELSPPGGIELVQNENSAIAAPKTYLDQAKNYSISKVANALLAIETARRFGNDGILSVAYNPGNLKTPLQRHLPWWQYAVAWMILRPVRFGAYTELWAGWSEEVTRERNGAYVLPWGRFGRLRGDIEVAIMGRQEGGRDLARGVWEWCEAGTGDYR